MAWEDVPAKVETLMNIEYGGEAQVNATIAAYDGVQNIGGVMNYEVNAVPLNKRAEFEAALDYRIGACQNLIKSKAWPKDALRQV